MDVTITVDEDFLRDFLESLRPETTRGIAVCGTIKDAVLMQLLAPVDPVRGWAARGAVMLEDVAGKEMPAPKRKLSAAGRRAISIAQKKRWAAVHAAASARVKKLRLK